MSQVTHSPDIQDDRLPVIVLSGFLGSGKTTQLNHWLSQRQDLAVVINELGDIGIDQHLTEAQGVPVTLLAGGCVCCVVQGSLSSTLRTLFMARKNGEIPPFNKLLLETTGAAEPSGVVAPLQQDPWLRKRFVCQSVITLVDAQAGVAALERHPECLEQVQGADQLLISKSDLCTPDSLAALKAQIALLNPDASVLLSPGPTSLLDQVFPRRCRITGPLTLSTGVSLQPQLSSVSVSRHQLHSASLRWEGRLSWPHWQAALQQLGNQCGESLVRLKGLLKVEGLDGPLLVQWTGQGEPALSPMNAWPDGDTTTRLVVIVRHDNPDFVHEQVAHWQALLQQLG